MAYDVCVIGAPSSAGAYAPGQEKAPAAFRRHGLIAALREGGLRVDDLGDVAGFRWRPDLDNPKAMNVGAAAAVARAVADKVAEAVETAGRVLVLGGDCTVELGTGRRSGEEFDLGRDDLRRSRYRPQRAGNERRRTRLDRRRAPAGHPRCRP